MNPKKMRKIFIVLFIAFFVGNGTLIAQKNDTNNIKEIGKHLSELLISRGDISESSFALKIERLFPDEDFADFDDSPAEFILAMLYEAQITLPESWAQLLLQAESLGVNEKARYFKTYYHQSNEDSFTLTCVLKQSSKYYAFSSEVLGWEVDKYVIRIYKTMRVYNNVRELEENLFSIAIEEILEDLKEMENEEDINLPFKF